MTDDKLIAHAQRLHALACANGGTRHDLIKARDILPDLIDRLVAHIAAAEEFVAVPRLEGVIEGGPITLSVVK
jgi:hypothetical protein